MKQAVVRNSGRFALVWAFLILLLCATPGHFIPSAGWMELFSVDKLVHAGVFFVLAAFVIINVQVQRRSYSTMIVLLTVCIFYGFVLELLQATLFVGRSFELLDAVANTFGVLLAAFARNRVGHWAVS